MALPEQESLYTIAEIAVALLGVSGLVAVFLAKGRLHPWDRFRFSYIAMFSSLTVLLAFTPIWLARYVSDLTTVWAISSAGYLVSAWIVLAAGRLTSYEDVRRLQQSTSRAYRALGNLLVLIVQPVIIFNIVAWPFESNGTAYELALVLTIVHLALTFVGLALFRPPD